MSKFLKLIYSCTIHNIIFINSYVLHKYQLSNNLMYMLQYTTLILIILSIFRAIMYISLWQLRVTA